MKIKTFATQYNANSEHTSATRTVTANSKAKAAEKLGVKISQVYLFN